VRRPAAEPLANVLFDILRRVDGHVLVGIHRHQNGPGVGLQPWSSPTVTHTGPRIRAKKKRKEREECGVRR
jgi:hypothetical protein